MRGRVDAVADNPVFLRHARPFVRQCARDGALLYAGLPWRPQTAIARFETCRDGSSIVRDSQKTTGTATPSPMRR